tara:strand:+ start:94 stop:393 length:300 start_codon:yes stop_codon:yes gene_type:complete
MGTPFKMKGSPMARNFNVEAESPVKQAGLVKIAVKGAKKVYKVAKKAYGKYKKGKPSSVSTETSPSGSKTKTTTTYKNSTDRTFYNADGSVKSTSSTKN